MGSPEAILARCDGIVAMSEVTTSTGGGGEPVLFLPGVIMPAADHTAADRADPYWREIAALRALPEPAATIAFLRLQLAPGVEPTPPPAGTPPPWMAEPARTADLLRAQWARAT
jgi:hypothetical protein